MDITLIVDSYFEYFTTMLGWVIGNGIWDLFTQTGLFAMPFLAHIIQLFLKVREQGDDEGNKGRLLASWLENKLYLSLVVMILTCLPVFSVSYSSLQYNEARMRECGSSVIIAPERTGLNDLQSDLSGRSAKLPLWWGFTYTVGKGLTHGSIALLPCKPDLRQIRFEVQNTQITDPTLRQEVNDFVEQCFVPSRVKFKQYQSQFTVTEALARDIDWIGSSVFINTGGFYDSFYAKRPNPYFPYNATRDQGRPSGLGGGFPSCKEWWTDSRAGLYARLDGQVETSLKTKLGAAFGEDNYQDGIIRQLVSPQNMASSSGIRYTDYRSEGIISTTAGSAASTLGGMLALPVFESVRQALPMVQAFVSLAIIIGIPIIMVLSGYSITAMVTVGVVQVSIYFLSFWWELARWFDWWFIRSIEDDGSGDKWGLFFIGADDFILKIVSGSMFIVLPAIWFAIMAWAGFKGGHALNGIISSGVNTVQSSTQRATNTISNKSYSTTDKAINK